MFTGIVETVGTIVYLQKIKDCLHIVIVPEVQFTDLKIGDSVAVNGVCLTITSFPHEQQLEMVIVPETLRLTNLAQLQIGSSVNLERALQGDQRNGGHQVQGHVDGIGEIIEMKLDGKEALIIKCSVSAKLAKYIVDKGYITIDGMSLTVIEATSEWFSVTLIPHTQKVTIAHHYKLGTQVNIEVDILGKYVEKMMRYNKYASTH